VNAVDPEDIVRYRKFRNLADPKLNPNENERNIAAAKLRKLEAEQPGIREAASAPERPPPGSSFSSFWEDLFGPRVPPRSRPGGSGFTGAPPRGAPDPFQDTDQFLKDLLKNAKSRSRTEDSLGVLARKGIRYEVKATKAGKVTASAVMLGDTVDRVEALCKDDPKLYRYFSARVGEQIQEELFNTFVEAGFTNDDAEER
jgi:hypothetical protein